MTIKGWRTLGINLIIVILNFLAAYHWADVVDPKILIYVNGIGVPLINMALRFITDTPVGESK